MIPYDQGRRVIFDGIVNSEPVFHNGFTPSSKLFIQGLLKKDSTQRLGMGKQCVFKSSLSSTQNQMKGVNEHTR